MTGNVAAGTPLPQQRGAAVLVALLVVALATVAASSFLFQTRVEWRRLENLIRLDQAHLVLRATDRWAASVLWEDALHSSVDHRGEAWATRLPPVDAEGYRVAGWIEDQDGLFNLNNLVGENGRLDLGQLAVYQRLLRLLRLPPQLAETAADWLDEDDKPLSPESAETGHYASLPTPHAAANHRLASLNELLRVRGYNREIVDQLRPFVTVLPTTTRVNVNTAQPEVLAALVEGLALDEAYALVAKRQSLYYRNTQDFQQMLTPGMAVPSGIDVSSQFFLVRAGIRYCDDASGAVSANPLLADNAEGAAAAIERAGQSAAPANCQRLSIGNLSLYQRNGQSAPRLVWRAAL